MYLTIHVKAGASLNKVTQVDDTTYKVFTTTPPEKGKANEQVIKLMADFLHIPPSRLVIRFGTTSREKLIEILPDN